jgi:hypothetical protein
VRANHDVIGSMAVRADIIARANDVCGIGRSGQSRATRLNAGLTTTSIYRAGEYPKAPPRSIKITSALMARLGGSGGSGFRISNSSQFHTFSRGLSGFNHLHPTKSRMITSTSTMLINLAVPDVVPLPRFPEPW